MHRRFTGYLHHQVNQFYSTWIMAKNFLGDTAFKTRRYLMDKWILSLQMVQHVQRRLADVLSVGVPSEEQACTLSGRAQPGPVHSPRS